jgi:hypothetical protein
MPSHSFIGLYITIHCKNSLKNHKLFGIFLIVEVPQNCTIFHFITKNSSAMRYSIFCFNLHITVSLSKNEHPVFQILIHLRIHVFWHGTSVTALMVADVSKEGTAFTFLIKEYINFIKNRSFRYTFVSNSRLLSSSVEKRLTHIFGPDLSVLLKYYTQLVAECVFLMSPLQFQELVISLEYLAVYFCILNVQTQK